MPHVGNCGSQNDGFFNTSLKEDDLNSHVKHRNVDHTKKTRVHGLLKDVEVSKVLWLAIDISSLVESILIFNILVTGGRFLKNLESSAHFEK